MTRTTRKKLKPDTSNIKAFEEWLYKEGPLRIADLAKKQPNLTPGEAMIMIMDEMIAESSKSLGIRDMEQCTTKMAI